MLATVSCVSLRDCLSNLLPLFDKGSAIIPVGLKIQNNELTVICNNKCSFKDIIPVECDESGYAEVVIQYKNIIDYLPNIGSVEFEINNRGLFINHPDVSLTLPAGYSEYKELNISGLEFKPIVSTGYLSGLRCLLNFNLSSITKMEKPITVYQQLSVIKYPQLVAQTRTLGLPFSGVFTPDLINLMVKFQPTEVCDDNPACVTLKRNKAYLQIPREVVNADNNFMSYMTDLQNPIQLNFEGLNDKLRCMAKLGTGLECHVTIHEKGLSCSVLKEGTSITSKIGDCSSGVSHVFKIPLSIWNICVRALDSDTAQILYGGGKVCLRTQSIIIITRVTS